MAKLVITVALAAAFQTSCSSPANQPAANQTRPEPLKQAAQTAAAKVDLDKIFPPGRGQQLVLNNCTTCHTFVPIVILKMTKEAWERNSRDHRGRVTGLSNSDFQFLYEYLAANFGPHKPVPALPQELLDTWTSY
jgi:cytochrome c5